MKKAKAEKERCVVKALCIGESTPARVRVSTYLEDARKFEYALNEHRKWRRRNSGKNFCGQTFNLRNLEGRPEVFVLDLVVGLSIEPDEE